MVVFLSLFIFNHYMAVLGVVWAPVGAIICRVIASKLGLNPRRYTMLGGVYSLLLFFPWLYLVLRMLERRASRILIRVFYILALLSWFTTILWIVFVTPYLGLGVTLSITSIGLGFLNFVAWCVSVGWLLLNKDRPVPNVPPAGIWGRTLPQRGYLVPLALATFSTWATWLIILSGNVISIVQG